MRFAFTPQIPFVALSWPRSTCIAAETSSLANFRISESFFSARLIILLARCARARPEPRLFGSIHLLKYGVCLSVPTRSCKISVPKPERLSYLSTIRQQDYAPKVTQRTLEPLFLVRVQAG